MINTKLFDPAVSLEQVIDGLATLGLSAHKNTVTSYFSVIETDSLPLNEVGAHLVKAGLPPDSVQSVKAYLAERLDASAAAASVKVWYQTLCALRL